MSQSTNKLCPNFPLSYCPTPYSINLPILVGGCKCITALDQWSETQFCHLEVRVTTSKLNIRHYFCYNAWQIQQQALIKSSRFQSNAATFRILRAVNLRRMTRNSVAHTLIWRTWQFRKPFPSSHNAPISPLSQYMFHFESDNQPDTDPLLIFIIYIFTFNESLLKVYNTLINPLDT